jgi:very-short-patch-repair endonuclease
MLASRLRRGALTEVTGDVLVVPGSPRTDRRDAMVAVLAIPDAAVSHGSAAALWRLPGFDLHPIEVVSPRAWRRSTQVPAGRVHTTTFLPDSHVAVVDGLRITVPVRVLFDLAGTIHPGRLERLVDTAWRMRLVTGRLLRRTLAELEQRGRPGIAEMRELIGERGDGYRPTDSNAEGRFEALIAEVGITTFERQVDVGDADWLGRIDFRDRRRPLLVEIDSETFHGSIVDRRRDERRREALVDAGYRLVVITTFELWHRAREVQDRVLDARNSLVRAAPSAKLSRQVPKSDA